MNKDVMNKDVINQLLTPDFFGRTSLFSMNRSNDVFQNNGIDLENHAEILSYKQEIVENHPEELYRVDDFGTNILFVSDDTFFTDALLKIRPDELFRTTSNGDTLFNYPFAQRKYKDMLIEADPNILFRVDRYGNSCLMFNSVHIDYKRKMVSQRPEELCRVTVDGENILFFSSVESEFKEMLLEKHPEEATRVCRQGRNIAFRGSSKLIEDRYPHELGRVDNDGCTILSLYKVSDSTKFRALELFPDLLFTIDKDGKNLLFHDHVPAAMKEKLIELRPDELGRVDNKGRNILFFGWVSSLLKRKLLNTNHRAGMQIDDDGFWMNYGKKELAPIRTRISGGESGDCTVCQMEVEPGDVIADIECIHDIHNECFINYSTSVGKRYMCHCKRRDY